MAYDNNNSGGASRFPTREKNVLDDPKLSISAPTPGVDKAWAKFTFGWYGNHGHLTVWTNDPEDQTEKNGNGKIAAKLPPQDFAKALMMIDLVSSWPKDKEDKIYMEIKDYSWFGKQRSDDIEVQSVFWVGKNRDGEVWISLVSKDRARPKIQFKFGNTLYNILYHGDGTPFTNEETSSLNAKANVELIRRLTGILAVDGYKHPEKKDQGQGGGQRQGGGYNKGGGNGGGYNRNGNGGGGYNRNGGGNGGGGGNRDSGGSSGYDDAADPDIPF
jgi:hypothetical protein